MRPNSGGRRSKNIAASIPIVDVFAGPGGLGEGFSAYRTSRGQQLFHVRLSIEMDRWAHRTLLLRSFLRQFPVECRPAEYYEYLRGEDAWSGASVSDLLQRFPHQAEAAREEAWLAELRPALAEDTDRRITHTLGGRRSRGVWGLVGGPPCQAYSLVGRARMLRPQGDRFYADKRHTLYQEYLRLLARHHPTFFVLENVKGLLSSKSSGGDNVFERILADLSRPPGSKVRYRLFALSDAQEGQPTLFSPSDDPASFVVRAEQFGIPQARHRVIILGVAETELRNRASAPQSLARKTQVATTSDATKDLPALRSGLSGVADSCENWLAALRASNNASWFRDLRRTALGDIAQSIQETVKTIQLPPADRGARFVRCDVNPAIATDWFSDSRLDGVCNHQSRGHMLKDLHRYLFVSSYGKCRGKSVSYTHLTLPTKRIV